MYRLIFWLSNHSYLKYLSENHPNSPAPFGLMLPDSHRRTHSLAMHPAVLQHHFPWLHKILFHLLQNLQFCSIINLFNIQHPGVDSDKPGQKSAFDSKDVWVEISFKNDQAFSEYLCVRIISLHNLMCTGTQTMNNLDNERLYF